MARPLALLLAIVGWLAFAGPARADPQFPELTGRVVDAASIIPTDMETRLTGKLEKLQNESGRQLVVATIPDLQDYDIENYGYLLGRHWAIGSKDKNDGVLLIVAPKERRLRIEVGYGLEGVLTDGLSSLIINDTIVPRFKSEKTAEGIEAGADEIIKQLSLPDTEAQKLAAEADAKEETSPWPIILTFVFLMLGAIAIIVFVPRLSRSGGRVGTWLNTGSSSSGGSSPSFSGGGGSFGGGGASGSW